MKGFLKRLLGLILIVLFIVPLLLIQFTSWLFRGKGVGIFTRFMDWISFDLVDT